MLNVLQEEEQVKCRIDHYQTPAEVHVSIFAKKVVKEQSSVKFEVEQVRINFSKITAVVAEVMLVLEGSS